MTSCITAHRQNSLHKQKGQRQDLHIAIGASQISDEEGVGPARRAEHSRARALCCTARAIQNFWSSGDELIALPNNYRVLTLCPLPVVQPPDRILSIACKVVERIVVARSQLSSPPSVHRVQHEVTSIQVIVRLVPNERSGLHRNVQCIIIRPTAPHRCPLIRWIREESVERKITPPGTGHTWIVPEHRPRFRRVPLITLVEDVLGELELGAVEDDRIGGRGELVGASVAIVEEGGWSMGVHVVVASLEELRVCAQHLVVGPRRGQERRGHLGVTGGTKVPVVGRLCPSAISGNAVDTILESVGDGLAKEVLGDSGGIISEDRESTHGEAAIANAIPVARDVRCPPTVDGVRSVKHGLARSQSVEDHVVPHLLLLVIGQDVIKPIVTNGISGGELGGIQKVSGVPFVDCRTKAV